MNRLSLSNVKKTRWRTVLWLGLSVCATLLLTACPVPRLRPIAPPTPTSPPRPTFVTATPAPTATASAAKPMRPIRAGAPSIGDPKTPELGNTGYDVQQYTLTLAIDPPAETLSGTVAIDAVTTLADLGRLSLDFSGPYTLTRLTVDDQPAAYQWRGEKLSVDLPRPLPLGAAFTLSVGYYGRPEPILSRYLPFAQVGLSFADGAAYALAEPDGTRAWFPVNDHPRDKARFRFEINAPQGYVVAANGQPERPIAQDDGSVTHVWDSDMLIAPYLVTVAIDDFDVIEQRTAGGLTIRHFVPPDLDEETRQALLRTSEMIPFLEHYFGPYPFDSYGHALVPVQGVALETQTMTLLPADITPRHAERVILHELAHQWFGDSVSPASWADIWLNEGFATYAEWLWLEAQSPQALATELINIERVATFTDSGEPLADPAPEHLFGFSSYIKGAWVLHMLRYQVGDATFFRLLRTWHQRFRDGVASTADLQQLAEEISGQELEVFFDQWVYGTGIPAWTLYWRQTERAIEVRVCQSQEQLFNLPLTLALQGAGQDQTVQLLVDERAESGRFPVAFAVSDLLPDPDQHILADVKTENQPDLPACP